MHQHLHAHPELRYDVHQTAARGYAGCSHGCVNIRDRTTLKWVYARIRLGDRVVVYFG